MPAWKTSDIYLASFLIASGNSVLKNIIDGANDKKIFVFEPEPSREVILRFYAGDGQVSPLRLFESFQRLKSATYVLNSKSQKVI